jgi:nitronate monooxygenase
MSRASALARQLADLRLPVLQAPMFRVSSARLAAACSRAGLVGAFQLANPESLAELEAWLVELAREERARRAAGQGFAPFCVNVNASRAETTRSASRCASARACRSCCRAPATRRRSCHGCTRGAGA